MEETIINYIRKNISKEPSEIIDGLLDFFKAHYDRPVSSISEIKERESKKIRGDMLEVFCKLYFKSMDKFTEAWLLEEVPEEIREKLKLKKQDLGIDLILQDQSQNFYAVQVKYRQHPKYRSKNVIGWKQLSTFYALVKRTGPYKQHIVFTNADYVRHVGERDPKDRSYCIGSLRKMKKEHLLNIIESGENMVEDKTVLPQTLEELRLQRIKVFEKKF